MQGRMAVTVARMDLDIEQCFLVVVLFHVSDVNLTQSGYE